MFTMDNISWARQLVTMDNTSWADYAWAQEVIAIPNGTFVMASQSHIINQNGATSGFEMLFCAQHLWCRVPTVPTKTRLESRFCNKEVYAPFNL